MNADAEEHEGSWCKKDLEKKDGCSRVHVITFIWTCSIYG